MQLFRILQSQGFGSRRDCRTWVLQQRVMVNGVLANDPEQEFSCVNLEFSIDGKTHCYREHAYLALHKPAGFECSHQPRDHRSVFSLLPAYLLNRGVQCVGRLDQDTTGLLLFSDDGKFIHNHTSPKKQVSKTYQVTCKHTCAPTQIEQLLSGVQLHDEPAPIHALRCRALSEYRLELVISEGKYHQVKRMLAAVGNRVESLHRAAIGGFCLPAALSAGDWQWLQVEDLAALQLRAEKPIPVLPTS